MDEKDVIKHLGQPDQIIDRKDRMRSVGWVCSACRSATAFAAPMPCPAPCSWCGGVTFEAVDGPPQ